MESDVSDADPLPGTSIPRDERVLMSMRSDAIRIGIDATCLGSARGYGRFLRELLPPLCETDDGNEYVFFLDAHTAREVGPLPGRTVEIATRSGQAESASATGRRGVIDMLKMGRAVSREDLDVMFFPSVYSYYPVLARLPVVVAFHDTIAERHSDVVFPSRTTRWAWQAKVAVARRQARVLVTVSDWSRRSLADYFGTPADQIHVIPEAPSPVFRESAARTAQPDCLIRGGWQPGRAYFIYVGGFNPHKNLHRLVGAFARAAAEHPASDVGLLMVGDFAGDNFHADVDALRGEIERLGITSRVLFPGFVPDDELRALYTDALALVIPSLEEGFGLPAVEAAVCGTPCIATTHSPLPELLSGGGLFVAPTDESALADAVSRILDDEQLRVELGANAEAQARTLTWDAAAQATRKILAAATRVR